MSMVEKEVNLEWGVGSGVEAVQRKVALSTLPDHRQDRDSSMESLRTPVERKDRVVVHGSGEFALWDKIDGQSNSLTIAVASATRPAIVVHVNARCWSAICA